MSKILIVGAGIAGLSLARLFELSDISYRIIDARSEEMLPEGAGIALPANAMQALRHIGLGSDIDQQAHQVQEIIYTNSQGETLNQASLLEPPLNKDHFVALHRHKLHQILRAGIQQKIEYNKSIQSIEQTENSVRVKFTYPENQKEEFSAVIGADGINSQVRKLISNNANADNKSHSSQANPINNDTQDLGLTTWRWVCPYPDHLSLGDLQPTYMIGAQNVFMAYPISGLTQPEIYCYAHILARDNLSSISNHQEEIKHHFGEYGGIAKTLLEKLPENDAIIRGRLRSVNPPIFAANYVALIGDAAHACSPMLQQGAALAIEDAIILSELIKRSSIKEAFAKYEKIRAERVNWVINASDGPIKMLASADVKMLAAIQQKIREQGPLNVLGWRELLKTDPIEEILARGQACATALSL